jgi:hypothetical protein
VRQRWQRWQLALYFRTMALMVLHLPFLFKSRGRAIAISSPSTDHQSATMGKSWLLRKTKNDPEVVPSSVRKKERNRR